MPEENRSYFMRLPQVLAEIPVSKSTWWAGCKSGKYPAPVKLSARTTAWKRMEIEDLCARLCEGKVILNNL